MIARLIGFALHQRFVTLALAVLIGGLVSATAMTLLVLPAVYDDLFARAHERRRGPEITP